MNTRKAALALVAAMLSTTAAVANASSTFHPSNDEAGTENHVSPGTRSKAQRAESEGAEARPDPNWTFAGEAAGWVLREHSYDLRGGRIIHTDDFPHDTTKPPLGPGNGLPQYTPEAG